MSRKKSNERETMKFPNSETSKGWDVPVIRKDEIINSTDFKTYDKSIVLDIIKNVELMVKQDVSNGFNTSIPYLCSFKISDFKSVEERMEVNKTLRAAKESLSQKDYVAFKLSYFRDIKLKADTETYYLDFIRQAIKANKLVWSYLLSKMSEPKARLTMWLMTKMNMDYE